MAPEQKNLKIVQDAYAAWGTGKEASFEHWMDLCGDEVAFHSLAGGAPAMEFTTVCRSPDDVRRYFSGLAKDWEMQHFTPEQYLADGDWVVMRGSCSWRNRNTGKTVDSAKADFLRLRDGKIVEMHEFFDTAAAFAAAR